MTEKLGVSTGHDAVRQLVISTAESCRMKLRQVLEDVCHASAKTPQASHQLVDVIQDIGDASVELMPSALSSKCCIRSLCAGICIYDKSENGEFRHRFYDELKFEWDADISIEYKNQIKPREVDLLSKIIANEQVRQLLVDFHPNVFPRARSDRSGYSHCKTLFAEMTVTCFEWENLRQAEKTLKSHILLEMISSCCCPCVLNVFSIRSNSTTINAYIYCSFHFCRLFNVRVEMDMCRIWTNMLYFFHVGSKGRQLRGVERVVQKKCLVTKMPSTFRSESIHAANVALMEMGHMQEIRTRDVLQSARSEQLRAHDKASDNIDDLIERFQEDAQRDP